MTAWQGMPHELRGLGLRYWRVLVRTARGASDGRYGMVASSIAFFSFLALLPFLAAVALAYGVLTEPARVVDDIRSLIQIVPAEARQVLGSWLIEGITRREGRTAGLAISAALSLLSAMRAGQSIIAGLNIACGAEHGRGFVGKRAAALVMVLCGSSLILTSLFALSALAFVEELVPDDYSTVVAVLRTIFWSVATVGATLALLVIYRHAPARKPPSWRRVLPGAVCATLLWLAATTAFGYYIGSFGRFGRAYGSLGAVIVLQIWLFLSAYIFLLGAKLNTEIDREIRREAACNRGGP